ncbi:MAG TPA: sialate O-acetylesterase, partial [Humisphaera sp.]
MITTRRTFLAAGLSAAAGLLIAPARLLAADGHAAFAPPAKDKFLLFLLVGQSNMAGRGKVEDEDRKPHPRVVSLDKAGQWVPAVDPIHFDKP